MNIMTFGQIEEVLADIEFFSGTSGQDIIDNLDEMVDFEILYTIEALRDQIVTRLIEEGRTYE